MCVAIGAATALRVVGNRATALGEALLDVATTFPLPIVSLGWKVCVGSGEKLGVSCVARIGVGPDRVRIGTCVWSVTAQRPWVRLFLT